MNCRKWLDSVTFLYMFIDEEALYDVITTQLQDLRRYCAEVIRLL